MYPFFCSLVCFGSFQLCYQHAAENRDIAMLKKAPSITGRTYQCGEMVQVVNHLRQLGRDKSLAALRGYITGSVENEKVLVICRLLFVNPKGWEPPGLGMPIPAVNEAVVKKFPLFPLGLSSGVPFLLTKGYELDGRAESAIACLKLCEGFALVKEDYPLADYEKAARALTQMDSFRQLYQEADRQGMAEMILNQAKITKASEKK